MKKINLLTGLLLVGVMSSCGDYSKKDSAATGDNTSRTEESAPAAGTGDAPSYDPKRGVGKWTAENVNVSDKLNPEWVKAGESISNTKCMSCHKLSDEKLVGPGWAGVTKRRTPEWLMNFITNPDEMLDKDPEAQAMLEICLVRMPNQNLSDGEARSILEFMRANDGQK